MVIVPETRRKPTLVWFDTGDLITINTSIGKKLQKVLGIIGKKL